MAPKPASDPPDASPSRAPREVLEPYAVEITRRYDGVLRGAIDVVPRGRKAALLLRAVVPSMSEFRYLVATVSHPPTLYPAEVLANDVKVACADEAALVAVLDGVFSAAITHETLSALLEG